MPDSTFTFTGSEGNSVFVYRWVPEKGIPVIGALQIAHGFAEHAGLYDVIAYYLNKAGYIVYANDHRGHGKTAGSKEKRGVAYNLNGHIRMVEDMHTLTEIIKQENPDKQVYLLGHSMGSYFTQIYMGLYGKDLNGAILSSSTGPLGIQVDFYIFVAWFLGLLRGRNKKDKVIDNVCLGTYNSIFKPAKKEFDWISQDTGAVDIYDSSPYCDGVYTAGFFHDLFKSIKIMHTHRIMKKIPLDLPVFIFSGSNDPISRSAKTVKDLFNIYRKMGIKDVEMKIYPGVSHMTLYGTGQDAVLADILDWLKRH